MNTVTEILLMLATGVVVVVPAAGLTAWVTIMTARSRRLRVATNLIIIPIISVGATLAMLRAFGAIHGEAIPHPPVGVLFALSVGVAAVLETAAWAYRRRRAA